MLMSALVIAFFSTTAYAHDSLVPHTHPHSVSMLPGIETSLVALLLLAITLVALTRFRRG